MKLVKLKVMLGMYSDAEFARVAGKSASRFTLEEGVRFPVRMVVDNTSRGVWISLIQTLRER